MGKAFKSEKKQVLANFHDCSTQVNGKKLHEVTMRKTTDFSN